VISLEGAFFEFLRWEKTSCLDEKLKTVKEIKDTGGVE
jgi:hypothetical protein